MAVGFGHWHANNCEGIHPSYAVALDSFGAFVQVGCAAADAQAALPASGGREPLKQLLSVSGALATACGHRPALKLHRVTNFSCCCVCCAVSLNILPGSTTKGNTPVVPHLLL